MSKKSNRVMIELRGESSWVVWWPREADDRDRTKLGLKESTARRHVEELVAPVRGYEGMYIDPHWNRYRPPVHGHGMNPDDVRVVPFRKGTWSRYEE